MDCFPAAGDSSREEFLILGTLVDSEIERRLVSLVGSEAESTAAVVAHIAEFDRRRLYAPKRFPSMFEYCTKILGYSEGAAYLRIYAGRLSRDIPEILEMIRDRKIHLTAVRTIGPHLNASNRTDLLHRCLGKTEKELKFLIADIAPRAVPAEVVRRLPASEPAATFPPAVLASAPASSPAAPASGPASPPAVEPSPPPASPWAVIEPLTPARIRFAFTGTAEFLRKFERAKELLRRKHPAGALEDVFAEAIEDLLDARDPLRRKPARPRPTNPRSRRVPKWVQDRVQARDAGRCAFLDDAGHRCAETGALEYDHIKPWAKGGRSDDPDNIRLLCRTHNRLAAEQSFPGLARARRPTR